MHVLLTRLSEPLRHVASYIELVAPTPEHPNGFNKTTACSCYYLRLHTELPLAHGSGPPCNNGDIRLVDGQDEFHGRVEMCQEIEWKTVCDIGWGKPEAEVVCRQLGYSDTEYG